MTHIPFNSVFPCFEKINRALPASLELKNQVGFFFLTRKQKPFDFATVALVFSLGYTLSMQLED
jgi:hypothetical protein